MQNVKKILEIYYNLFDQKYKSSNFKKLDKKYKKLYKKLSSQEKNLFLDLR